MIRFNCDYVQSAHEDILKRMMETKEEQLAGYGEDRYCEQARKLIRDKCQCPDACVQFLSGGTQSNLTVIAAALRPHQAVISADTGHINTHETGAVEAAGHRVIALNSTDGKLRAKQILAVCEAHRTDVNREHTVQPKMVYISNPTESGTLYSKKELEEISESCRECGLYLFMDGARLGYGLTAQKNDLDLPSIARYCDVFTIGGTKCGALFGEAAVITNPAVHEDFRYMIKQRGGMLAKGWLLGLQFLVLLEDDLYFRICGHANEMAMRLRAAFENHGCDFMVDSTTNQQFPVLKNEELDKLKSKYSFSFWEKSDETHSVVRFCTSWATKEEDVTALIEDLKRLSI